jgi:hypothetical protein
MPPGTERADISAVNGVQKYVTTGCKTAASREEGLVCHLVQHMLAKTCANMLKRHMTEGFRVICVNK